MRVAVGCVAENTPKYLSQAMRLVQSIRWLGGSMSHADLFVCVVGDISDEYLKELDRYEVSVQIVERFSIKHPPSNKLRFLELPELANYDHVLLLDCDTIIVRDPFPELLQADFSAKMADNPSVPTLLFERLFDFFGLGMPADDYFCTVQVEKTIPYFNAGVLAFSKSGMTSLVPVWIELNKKLLENLDILQNKVNYCEQASLSLALSVTHTRFKVLSNAFNFPLHLEHRLPSEGLDPYIIHYHWLVDASGYIQPSISPAVNQRIYEFNSRLRREREKGFNNRLFWNQRYLENPGLGSGLGSRGEVLEYKRLVLENAVDQWNPLNILDIGCGDLEVGSVLPSSGYTGLDHSDAVININRAKYPNRNFVSGNFLEMETVLFDMVVCMDVLIHIATTETYRQFVYKLVRCVGEIGIVAGDETDPELGGIVFFHEPLSDTLAKAGAKNIREIGKYRHVTIFQFSPPG